ncbi:hypothetical protein ACFL0V_05985 [Nanoarchaeota archaeon]
MKYISLSDGLRFPWGRPGRLWNILWLFVPIFGWLALIGYGVTIIKSIVKGDTKKLPAMEGFWEHNKIGFMYIIRLIPIYVIIYLLGRIPFIGVVVSLCANLFFLPYLAMNVAMKEKLSASFEFMNVWNALTKDFVGYIVALLKGIVYALVYVLASIILIGIPCLMLGSQVFMANWFSKHWKK